VLLILQTLYRILTTCCASPVIIIVPMTDLPDSKKETASETLGLKRSLTERTEKDLNF
jgi:hypothetical protein